MCTALRFIMNKVQYISLVASLRMFNDHARSLSRRYITSVAGKNLDTRSGYWLPKIEMCTNMAAGINAELFKSKGEWRSDRQTGATTRKVSVRTLQDWDNHGSILHQKGNSAHGLVSLCTF